MCGSGSSRSTIGGGSTDTPSSGGSTTSGPASTTAPSTTSPSTPPSPSTCSGVRSADSTTESCPASSTATPTTTEVNESVTQVISNAFEPYTAWNGTYSWRSKFTLTVDQANCSVTVTIKIKVTGTVTEAQKTAWKTACEGKWNGKAKFCCTGGSCPSGYPVSFEVQYVTSGEHYRVTPNSPTATSGGRSGRGGTTSMTGWGVNDTVDITHEFGHMLGNCDEYFTTNGTNYVTGGVAFRRSDGGIMNNPANDPALRNYDFIRGKVATALGSATCTTENQ